MFSQGLSTSMTNDDCYFITSFVIVDSAYHKGQSRMDFCFNLRNKMGRIKSKAVVSVLPPECTVKQRVTDADIEGH